MQQTPIMRKSDLINNLTSECHHLDEKMVDEAVREIIGLMSDALINNERIEIRGFGSFSLHHREPRQARNPRTGEIVMVDAKSVPHFKPGKALRELVNQEI